MQDINQRVKELSLRLEKIGKALDLEGKSQKVKNLEAKATDPDLWDDPDMAKETLQAQASLKKELDEFRSLSESVKTLDELSAKSLLTEEFSNEVVSLEKTVREFELTTLLAGEYDGKNAVVAIHAGQGGVEAMDWASMLYRMYTRFCERRGWTTETIEYSAGEEAGIKSVTFKVEGNYAYGYLKSESGAHRLVRQSPFNADKLRQTSFANVEVLPELSETDLPDIEIKEEDLEWQFFRAGSQGGQNVNKVSTAVRLIHAPTGIAVTAQTERFQEQNRKNALVLLRAKLWLRKKEEEKLKKQTLKGEYKPASWGNQIRSYVLHPYKMVKDLRTRVETANTEAVLDGEIEELVEAALSQGP